MLPVIFLGLLLQLFTCESSSIAILCVWYSVGQSQDTDTSEVEEESAEQSLTKCLTSLYKTVLEHRVRFFGL